MMFIDKHNESRTARDQRRNAKDDYLSMAKKVNRAKHFLICALQADARMISWNLRVLERSFVEQVYNSVIILKHSVSDVHCHGN